MIRGTTPKLTLTVQNADFSNLKNLYITFQQKDLVITKGKDDVDIDENVITVPFTQEETLSFSKGVVDVQIRFTTDSDEALATTKTQFSVSDILRDGVIE